MLVLSAPKEILDIVNHYDCLNICEKCIKTPYYINKYNRHDLQALVGKGLPQEIENEVLIWAKLRGIDLCALTNDEIRSFMQKEGIGIDCSGFVYHLLDAWAKITKKRSISRFLKYDKGLRLKIAILIRPAINISADRMTNATNTNIVNLEDVKPGDLLRLKALTKGDHIAIILRVFVKDGVPTAIEIAESSQQYGVNNGIRISKIKIIDINKSLLEQEWLDKDENGICWTKEQLAKNIEDNGLRRLKFISLKYDVNE